MSLSVKREFILCTEMPEKSDKKLLCDQSKEKPTVFRSQLVLSLAKNLTSYQKFPTVEPTVNGTLTVIYQKLCANHGTMLTNNVLGLISIPRLGFSPLTLYFNFMKVFYASLSKVYPKNY